jgi:hypothetical protein
MLARDRIIAPRVTPSAIGGMTMLLKPVYGVHVWKASYHSSLCSECTAHVSVYQSHCHGNVCGPESMGDAADSDDSETDTER